MNYFEQYLDPTMHTPTLFGWFHMMWLGILAIAIIIFITKFKDTNDKTNRNVFLTFTILFYILEIYKQINFTLSAGHYQWYAFPFQFCSTPLYLFPFMIILKEGKFKMVLYDFIGTYIFVAGVSVMVDPVSVYVTSIGINIQTMIHHGMMVLAGLYVMISNRSHLTYKDFIKNVFVFIGFVSIADSINLIFHQFLIPNDTFNMFMISPYFHNNMPVLMNIRESAPYIVFLLSYIIIFSILAFIALIINRGIRKLIKKQVIRVYYRNLKLLFNNI